MQSYSFHKLAKFVPLATPFNGVHLKRFKLITSKTCFMYVLYHQLERTEILCSTHNAFTRSAWISEQTAIISPYNINLPVFIIEEKKVYCAVRTESLNQTDTVSSLKRQTSMTAHFEANITHSKTEHTKPLFLRPSCVREK